MGGAERQALYFVEHLAAIGRRPAVLTFSDGPALRPSLDQLGVPVHAFDYYGMWSAARRTRTLARIALHLRLQVKPQAILPFGSPASKATGLIWRRAAARYTWWNQQDEGRGLGGTATERRILLNVPDVTSNSWAGRDFLASTYGLNPSKIRVYNNGTPLPDQDNPPGRWRTRLDAGDRPIVAMIANVTPFKDHETLIEAWQQVKAAFPPGREPLLALAGYAENAKLQSAIKTRAFDLGLSSNDVRFLGAIDDVEGLIRDSQLVVHSSVTEGCPNSVCEAMAVGRAIVASDIPGCRQALGDSKEQLVPGKDAASLGRRIVDLLNDDNVRQQIGMRNRQRIRTEFSIEKMNSFFTDLMDSGVARASAQNP